MWNQLWNRQESWRKFWLIGLLVSILFSNVGAHSTSAAGGAQLYWITVNNKVGFIDRTGKVVIEPTLDIAWDFSEGLAPFGVGEDKERRWGYIDETAKVVIEPIYMGTWPFQEGLAAVEIPQPDGGSRIGFINKEGRLVLQPQFDIGFGFKEGRAWVGLPDSHDYLLIDTQGRRLTRSIFVHGNEFSEGLAAVQVYIEQKGHTLFGFVNRSGKFVIQPRFWEVGDFSEGLAPAELDNFLWGYIDKTGKWVIPPNLYSANPFSQGLASVRVDSGYGYIDKTGAFVIEPKFAFAGNFSEGLAAASMGDKLGYIDRSGKFVIAERYDEANPFDRGLAGVKIEMRQSGDFMFEGGKFGYIDQTGRYIWEPRS